jgi:S-disulfanyl-L-cysteine oxidoreductase SoxD
MRNKTALLLAASALLSANAIGQRNNPPQVGRTPSAEEIKQWDITVLPNGDGLPSGSGTPDQGEAIYKAKCATCHGENGEGKPPIGVPLVGGIGTLATDKPVKTIGSYWPYATTVWDYIHRSMPYNEPGTLSADDTYAVTAFLLFKNGIVARNQVMNKETLPKVEMPNRDGFIADSRPDVGKSASPAREQK